jgi:hypothetical protein
LFTAGFFSKRFPFAASNSKDHSGCAEWSFVPVQLKFQDEYNYGSVRQLSMDAD